MAGVEGGKAEGERQEQRASELPRASGVHSLLEPRYPQLCQNNMF